ncbi:amino acid adenylation domain-containing protein, partial [Rhodoplanes sp. TEM]
MDIRDEHAPDGGAALPGTAPDLDSIDGLCGWLARATGVDPCEIEPDVPMLELGVDSITVMRLATACARQGVTVTFAELMREPTVTAWVKIIAARRASGSLAGDTPNAVAPPAADAVPAADDAASSSVDDPHAPFPLTDVQRAYWLGRSDLFELGRVAAHGYAEIEAGLLDLDRLERALDATIARHPMLRAVVGSDGTQRVLASVPRYRIARGDWRGLAEADAEQRLLDTRQAMEAAVLPAERWPLFDIRASLLPGERTVLHVGFDVLIIDLASLERWMTEWRAEYDEPGRLGRAAPTARFADYVRRIATLRAELAGTRARAYWDARRSTLPPCPDLPLARDPAEIDVSRFVRRQATIAPGDWLVLKHRAAQEGLTPSSLLLAVYAQALAQWSRSRHFTINLTLFNRDLAGPGFEETLGDFTSLVLVEADLRPCEGFSAAARHIQSQLWCDLDHRLVSGVEVMARSAERQRAPRRATMPVVFTSGVGIGGYLEAFERFGRLRHGATQTPQTWIDYQVVEYRGGVRLIWDSVDALFPDGLIGDLFAAHTGLLRRLVATPEAWTTPVPALRPPAQAARAAAANRTGRPVAAGLLHAPFVEQARLRPEAVAVVAPDRTLTYAALDRASDRLAQALLDAVPLGPGRLVAVCLPSGWRRIVAVLAVLKAGAAYVPLDPAAPPLRLRGLMATTRAAVVLAAPGDALPWAAGVGALAVDDALLDDALLDGAEVAAVAAPAAPEDLAYVIFTSGSTGEPKGVMIEHRAALNTVLDVAARYRIGADDRVLAVSALTFDLSVFDIFGVLAAGGALVLPAPDETTDPAAWARLIGAHRVTVWNSVPALMRLLVDHLRDHDALAVLERLRVVLLSGDWLPLPLAREIAALPGTRRFVCLGGATEAAIWSIAQPIDAVPPDWPSVPYGCPLANQSVHVLDGQLAPRPDWVPGDLYIGGAGLARGYWEDAARTAASFLIHPETGERLYRTGDLGCRLPDGSIRFLGREDDQVKVNGLRVELGEIESALCHDERIRQAAALVIRSAEGDRLVAFVVDGGDAAEVDAAGVGPVDGEAVRVALRERLPAALIPTTVHRIAALPLTRNGKIDRAALLAEAVRRDEGAARAAAPAASETERAVAEVWAEVLSRPPAGVDLNFFEAGGTSLLAIRLGDRLARRFGRPVPVLTVFRNPTVAAQARLFAGEEKSAAAETAM